MFSYPNIEGVNLSKTISSLPKKDSGSHAFSQ